MTEANALAADSGSARLHRGLKRLAVPLHDWRGCSELRQAVITLASVTTVMLLGLSSQSCTGRGPQGAPGTAEQFGIVTSDSANLVLRAVETYNAALRPEDRAAAYRVLKFTRDSLGVLIGLSPAPPPGSERPGYFFAASGGGTFRIGKDGKARVISFGH